MQKRSLVAHLIVFISAVLALVAIAPGALAQNSVKGSFEKPSAEPVQINVLVGQSRVINFDRQIGRFSVSNPEVAEAVLVAPDQVLVNGKAFGQVNFIAWEKSGRQFIVFDVFVRANLSLIDSQMRALFPKEDIQLSQANGSVVLSGNVASVKAGEQVEAVVKAAGFNTVNLLQTPVNNAQQVQLNVRVAEVSRNKLRELGTSYTTAKGGTSFGSSNGLSSAFSAANLLVSNNFLGLNAQLLAMQTQGTVRSLAEPNLVAMSGQQASFLAGGEFPIPVVQQSTSGTTVTIVFKEYGVRLNFKPTIIDEDHIRLELEPEVSTIDFQNGVKFDGFLIPALKTRRAKTGVELRDGQAFALAGLIDNSEMQTLSKVPLLGDIPVLGALFKSKSFEKHETELVFFCEVKMVKPVNRDDLPDMRGLDGVKSGSPLGVEPKGEGITGDHGYSTGKGASSSTTNTPAVKPATDADRKEASGAAEARKPATAEAGQAVAATEQKPTP